MTRLLKKGPFVCSNLLDQIEDFNNKNKKKIIKTYSRTSTVIPTIIGHNMAVHNGQEFFLVLINNQIVGHKLGEFAFTRTFRGHIKSDKKSKRLYLLWDRKFIHWVFV